jgi:hypothetical protein
VKSDLRQRLLEMEAEDRRVRAELLAQGVLGDGYHPRMEEVHRQNAAALAAIIEEHGWPGRTLVSDDGAHAAWFVIQHAIGNPSLQRRGLQLLRQAAEKGEIPLLQVAYLEDRIRFFEGRPQLYGTQFHWDANGELNPHPIDDLSGVDQRRASVGLGPLAERIRRMREEAARSGERPPDDWAERQRKFVEWARSVGWRE